MASPHAIQVHCDGAMDYDTKQTGGNGFTIDFPDSLDKEPIHKSIRNDKQGIHRLEMISIIEAMEELLAVSKQEPALLRQAAGIEIYTDRIKVTDEELANPYAIRNWRKNGWKNHEDKAIKDSDLLDKIDKTRLKLTKIVSGPVTIGYKRRKHNRVADKLAKVGKTTTNRGKKIYKEKQRRVIRRKYDGAEINYPKVSAKTTFSVRVYAWEPVSNQFEVCFEICSGNFKKNIIKTIVKSSEKKILHRGHCYIIKISRVFKHHVQMTVQKEIICTSD
ncbi:MAG: hypothetical protein KAS07_01325 [Candidatus Pacebacteria bacterium]|nr:hypothetical protein [Candidatus Paceibacterota bacterium]